MRRRRILAQSLKIPLAHDETGCLVSVEFAIPGRQYFCPACGTLLILRRGTIKVPHFAHKPSDVCNQETIVHKTAKLIVQQAIADWKAEKTPAPVIQRACQVCHSLVAQPLPDKVETAVLEYHLSDGFIADVALLVQDKPEAVIEILVTHAVDEIKATNISVPFIELDGYAVLDSPTTWTPITDHFRSLTCPKCVQNFKRFQTKTSQIAKRMNLELPTDYYRYAPCSCWRCKKDILVFTWPGRQLHEMTPPRYQPVPKTIRFEYSKTVRGKYWANVCPHCQAIQGDWFLFAEPEGPFFGLDCEENTVDAFNRDLMTLAYLADYNGYL